MTEQWFYVTQGKTNGPVTREVLAELGRTGLIDGDTLVWKEGLTSWVQAATVEGLWLKPPPVPEQSHRVSQRPSWIKRWTRLPSPSEVPMGKILTGGLIGAESESSELLFASGTCDTTPSIANAPAPWPAPRVFWRLFLGTVIVFAILFILFRTLTPSLSPKDSLITVLIKVLPALTTVVPMMVVGALIQLSIVILFFELNLPRNVPFYQVLRMTFYGGALGLVLTVALTLILTKFQGIQADKLEWQLGIGIIWETCKALMLVAILRARRFKWELNGLLFGAAVGAGFACFQITGAAFVNIFANSVKMNFENAVGSSMIGLMLNSVLAPGGHVIWTAMIGAAIWRIKGDRPFEWQMLTNRLVLQRWFVAILLDALWNAELVTPNKLELNLLTHAGYLIVGWYFILASLREGGMEVTEARLKAIAARSPGARVTKPPIAAAPESGTQPPSPPHIPSPPDSSH